MSRKALLFGAAAAALLGLAPASALADQITFTGAGEHAFTVPAGVSRLQVELTGAPGGRAPRATGGLGATVTGTLLVTPGETLYAEVGGAGASGTKQATDFAVRPGGYNGGGSGAAGGGGASDLRGFPAALAGSASTRLAVAGGGGGAGFGVNLTAGDGGDAGAPGIDPSGGRAGGGAGTLSEGGAAGIGIMATGAAGGLGQGGNAANVDIRGGGGGGGYYGGGSGSGVGPFCVGCTVTGGAGGGSSLVPAGGQGHTAVQGEKPVVKLTWETPSGQLDRDRLPFPDTPAGALSPAQAITVTNRAASSRLEIADAAVDSDDFIVTSSTCRSVAPGASCVVKVRFAPAAPGAKAATLTLSGNGPQLTVPLSGRAPEPASTQPQTPVTSQTQAAAAETARVVCHKGRCTVRFAGTAPRVTAKRAKVTAKLTRGGVTYAAWEGTAKRGPLHLTLQAKRAPAPGSYTLTVTIAGKRLTRAATV
jgi:hypothetical protein